MKDVLRGQEGPPGRVSCARAMLLPAPFGWLVIGCMGALAGGGIALAFCQATIR